MRKLKTSCEKIKRNLSFSQKEALNLQNFYNNLDIIQDIFYGQFFSLTKDLIKRIRDTLKDDLNDAKITDSRIGDSRITDSGKITDFRSNTTALCAVLIRAEGCCTLPYVSVLTCICPDILTG